MPGLQWLLPVPRQGSPQRCPELGCPNAKLGPNSKQVWLVIQTLTPPSNLHPKTEPNSQPNPIMTPHLTHILTPRLALALALTLSLTSVLTSMLTLIQVPTSILILIRTLLVNLSLP